MKNSHFEAWHVFFVHFALKKKKKAHHEENGSLAGRRVGIVAPGRAHVMVRLHLAGHK